MLKNFDPVMLCPDCQIIRTSRSRHCSICNQCVERFDHHCPWINNCVGTRNHGNFMCFLASVSALLLSAIVTVCMGFKFKFSDTVVATDTNQTCFLNVLPSSIYTETTFTVASSLVLLTSVFFVLPVLLLGVIQMRNFCVNKTTNERYARRANTVLSDSGSSRSSSRSSSMVSGHTGSMVSNNVESLLEAERMKNNRCGWVLNCY